MTNGSRLQRRILHAADFHLEFLGDKACHHLEMMVNLAIKAKVDLVIIAGDLFDNDRIDDGLVGFAVEQLQRLPVCVAILAGNHDGLGVDSVFERGNLWNNGANIAIFRAPQGEVLSLPELGVSLWGKPFVNNGGDIRPLDGIPRPQENGHWHIAVAHGYYVDTEDPFMSLQITQEQIATSGWDYIAMGHVALFECVCNEPVKAYYSGSPPISGTVAIVDLAEDTGVQVTSYSL